MTSTIKHLLVSIILLTSTFSCHSQNKEEMSKKATQLLGSLYKEVQFQDSAVNYNIGIQIGACAFEVLVNDFIVYHNAGNRGAGSVGMSAYINTNILKSGVQTWEVRVYPPKVNGKRLTELPEGVRIELRLEKLRFLSNGDVIELAPTRELFSTPLVSKEGKEVYAQAGMPAMVYKGTFNAEVPYELTGWSKSKDLSKMDEDVLLKMLVNEYKSFGALIENGQLDKLAERLLKSEQETAQSLFYNEAENEQIVDWFLEGYGMDNPKLYPLEKYKMTFWGNGRMVTLERIDMLFEPALAVKYFIDNKEKHATYKLYFHIPEGSDKLEIIR